MPPGPIPARARVVIVDADRRVREGLAGLLEVETELAVVGTTAEAAEARTLVAATRADVVVVDPVLPAADDGLALIADLRATFPNLHIVAVSCSPELRAPTLAKGADTFSCKSEPGPSFADQIVRAMAARATAAGSAGSSAVPNRGAGPSDGQRLAASRLPDSGPASEGAAPASGAAGLEGC